MLNILLVCTAGMSTSVLVEKMKKKAVEIGKEVNIQAVGDGALSEFADDFDVISYIKESFVEPVKQPIDPTLPIVIQENNVDIKTEAIV